MATFRCAYCHQLFQTTQDTLPGNTDHRWCFVHLFSANKIETITDFYSLCLKHYEEVPPHKVVRKTIKVSKKAATMNVRELWAARK
jgi:hypothetical protein